MHRPPSVVRVTAALVATLGVQDWKIPVSILERLEQLALMDAGSRRVRLGKGDGYNQTWLPSDAHQPVGDGVPLEMVEKLSAQVGIRPADLQNACGAFVARVLRALEEFIDTR